MVSRLHVFLLKLLDLVAQVRVGMPLSLLVDGRWPGGRLDRARGSEPALAVRRRGQRASRIREAVLYTC